MLPWVIAAIIGGAGILGGIILAVMVAPTPVETGNDLDSMTGNNADSGKRNGPCYGGGGPAERLSCLQPGR